MLGRGVGLLFEGVDIDRSIGLGGLALMVPRGLVRELAAGVGAGFIILPPPFFSYLQRLVFLLLWRRHIISSPPLYSSQPFYPAVQASNSLMDNHVHHQLNFFLLPMEDRYLHTLMISHSYIELLHSIPPPNDGRGKRIMSARPLYPPYQTMTLAAL